MVANGSPRVVIAGLGHFHPKTVLDNRFFEGLDIGTSADWIDERVGISKRRSVLAKEDIIRLRKREVTLSQLRDDDRIMSAAEMCSPCWEIAWRRAQDNGGSADVETVIAGTSVPDFDIPAHACVIASHLGLDATGFDVNSACSSFVVDLHIARQLILGATCRSAAVFNPERYSTRLDFSDRSSCVLFGDGASAAILDATEGTQGLEVIDTIIRSNPAGFEHVQIPEGGYFRQVGRAVQKFAISKTIAVTLEILERNGLTKDDMNYFVGHQANLRMLNSAAEKQGVGPDRHLYNVDQFGNQGAAGAPNVISMNWDRFQSGDIIVVSVVGSGLTWGSALLRRT